MSPFGQMLTPFEEWQISRAMPDIEEAIAATGNAKLADALKFANAVQKRYNERRYVGAILRTAEGTLLQAHGIGHNLHLPPQLMAQLEIVMNRLHCILTMVESYTGSYGEVLGEENKKIFRGTTQDKEAKP
jgi:hypothetical protein